MNEIKPNWRIAQAISRQHARISMMIALPLFLGSAIITIIILKLLGYQDSGLLLKNFIVEHKKYFILAYLFIYFVPINLYAIIKLFSFPFPRFELKIFDKES